MDKDLLEERIDIDPDIEKEISQLQEAKLNATIKEDLEKVVKVLLSTCYHIFK